MVDIKKELGIENLHGRIVVNASVWQKQGEDAVTVEFTSTMRSFKKAERCRKRFSPSATLEIAKSDKSKSHCKTLEALVYRAKKTYEDGLALYDRGACVMGVLKCK